MTRGIVAAVIVFLPRFVDSLPIYGYGAAMVAGFLVASWVGSRRAQSLGLDPNIIWDVGLLILFSGVIGARLFYIISFPQNFFAPGRSFVETLFSLINLPDGGLVLYGGVIVGGLAFWNFCRKRNLSVLVMGDILITSIFIGEAFGRVGCFLYGCCWGDPTSLPWAVQFPKDSIPYQAHLHEGLITTAAQYCLPVHPTQIYSSVNALVLAILTGCYFPYRSRPGEVLLMGWFLYPISRFAIEILRAEKGIWGTPLTNAQFVSLGLLLSAVYFAWWLYKTPRSVASAAPVAATQPPAQPAS